MIQTGVQEFAKERSFLKRKRNPWQNFLSQQMKLGKKRKEAIVTWKEMAESEKDDYRTNENDKVLTKTIHDYFATTKKMTRDPNEQVDAMIDELMSQFCQ